MATRDAEKILMKELEQAIQVRDKAQAEWDKALAAQQAAKTILDEESRESDALVYAIIALRRGPATDTHRRNIENDARNSVSAASRKERPVA